MVVFSGHRLMLDKLLNIGMNKIRPSRSDTCKAHIRTEKQKTCRNSIIRTQGSSEYVDPSRISTSILFHDHNAFPYTTWLYEKIKKRDQTFH
jgi:hypothetical protein